MDRFEAELVQYFRETLENDQLTFEREVSKQEEQQKLYTNSDKFNYMVEKNPQLKDLRDKLGLDFDF